MGVGMIRKAVKRVSKKVAANRMRKANRETSRRRLTKLEAERDELATQLDLMNRAKELNRLMVIAASEDAIKLQAERYALAEVLFSALNVIQSSRKASMGGIDDVYVCQISVESAKGWRETLRRCEQGDDKGPETCEIKLDDVPNFGGQTYPGKSDD